MDGNVTSINFSSEVLLDIVDEDWLADSLSDDEIDIPVKHKLPTDDVDDTNEDETKSKAENTWMELALQQFLDDVSMQ
eukprot:CAMPEP_0114501170 /NCGR_PEP_ID=MMETSP0109-20121206/8354_1 /TAXON_ID=29199 /ORGANISM="Chlorarachnion reptans, Strain CCCM449" /LENGTH=77 /DNA_ID=CAMNT_0001678879 /DNA_START=93 /DNA_END=326 /DNA_ORIENTATION=-